MKGGAPPKGGSKGGVTLALDPASLRKISARIERELEKIAEDRAKDDALRLQREWKEVLSRPGSGRVYESHRASAPGQPPAPDSGLLRESIAVKRDGNGKWAVFVDDLKYPDGASTADTATILEFGGRNVAARPHARPAIEAFKSGVRK